MSTLLLKYDITSTEGQGIDLEKLNSNSAAAIFYLQRNNYKVLETRIVQSTGSYCSTKGYLTEYRLEIRCQQILEQEQSEG